LDRLISNLPKVSFHNNKTVKKVHVPTRNNVIINRLQKTKVEKHPDFNQERIDYLKLKRKLGREAEFLERKTELEEIERKREEKRNWDYSLDESQMYSNKGMIGMSVQEIEDDFM
jgi:hypothetical protein